MIRKVNFGTATYHFAQEIPEELKSQVWYSTGELQASIQSEIECNRQCVQNSLSKRRQNACLASHDLSWRGLECVQTGIPKTSKVSHYTQLVLHEYQSHFRLLCCHDPESLRLFANICSKSDRLKAQRQGAKDEKEAKKANHRRPKLLVGGICFSYPRIKGVDGISFWSTHNFPLTRRKLPVILSSTLTLLGNPIL